MPYRKSYRRTRRGKRYGRSYRRRFRRSSYTKRSGQKVFTFKRTKVSYISIENTLATAANSYKLNDLTDYTEFTNLFDEYKISGIKEKFIFDTTVNLTPAGNAAAVMPNLYHYLDYNDATPPASIAEMSQDDSLKINRLDKVVTRFFRPKILMSASDGATNTLAITPKGNPWISTAQPGIIHYGFKYAVDASMETGTGSMHVGKITRIATYYFKCKSPK